MQHYHEIGASRSQYLIALAVHLVAALTIFLYATDSWLLYAGLAAIVTSAWIEYRRLIQHGNILLRVDDARQSIELRQSGQSYFFCKYKVYESRWFAILKLVDKAKGRTLILTSDCFNSDESYRRLRFDLRRLAPSNAA